MKPEEQPETAAAYVQRIRAAVSELKARLQRAYERLYPGLGEIVRIIIDEEEEKAWNLSSFPHLLLPDLVEVHIGTLGLDSSEARHEDILAAPIDDSHAVAATY
jgi:hypothetical protein